MTIFPIQIGGSTRETNLLGHMATPYLPQCLGCDTSVPWLRHKLNQLTVSVPALPSGTRLRLNKLVDPRLLPPITALGQINNIIDYFHLH